MPKQKGLNLKQIMNEYQEKLNEMSAEISVLKETIKDIKESQSVPPYPGNNEIIYEHLPPNSAQFWDGYWSPSTKRSLNSLSPQGWLYKHS